MSVNKVKKKSRFRLLHQYYSYTGFYSFLGSSLLKALPAILLFVAVLLSVHFFVVDINDLLAKMTDTFPAFGILSVFFLSESVLGLLPPEVFIAWSGKTENPTFYLSILALLSYLGGVISFYIGRAITQIPSVHDYLTFKLAKHLKNVRKWGGFLIVVGALFPVPFSITSIAAGIINFPLRSFLLFALLRFVRFYIYAVAIYNIIS